jgi:hypothetical protein
MVGVVMNTSTGRSVVRVSLADDASDSDQPLPDRFAKVTYAIVGESIFAGRAGE